MKLKFLKFASWKTNYIYPDPFLFGKCFFVEELFISMGSCQTSKGCQLLQEDEQKRSRHVTWLHQVVCVEVVAKRILLVLIRFPGSLLQKQHETTDIVNIGNVRTSRMTFFKF